MQNFQIEIWTWVFLFITSTLFDACYVIYVRAINPPKPHKGSILSVALYLLGSFGIKEYNENYINIIPIIFGIYLGSFITLYISKRHSEKDS